jgi:hypothetical protein
MDRTRALALCSAVFLALLGAAVGTPPQTGGQVVTGTPGVANERAEVNLQELVAREAATLTAWEAPREIHAPLQQGSGEKVPAGVITGEDRSSLGAAETVAVGQSPAPSANFLACEDNGTVIPPDTHGAAGPNHLMVTVNSQVRIQSRTGSTLSSVSLNNFWASLGNPSTFDPRVFYDSANSRWIITAVANSRSPSSAVLIGVSKTNDPTGAWSLYKVTADTAGTTWADYPTLGFNKNWIVVQVNMFTNSSNSFSRSQFFAFNKSDLYAGGAGAFTRLSDTSGGFSSCPAQTFDNNLNTMFLVEDWNGNSSGSGFLRVSTITGSVGAEVLNLGVSFPSAAAPWADFTSSSNFAPQAGSTQKIANGDSRMYSVVYRNGSLWSTHTIFYPNNNATRASVQVWELDGASFAVKQRMTVDDPSGQNFHAYPGLAVNKNNDVLVGYTRFSTSSFASGFYSFRLGTDPSNTLQSPQLLKAGEAPYFKTFSGTTNRWGDYSNASVDPVNDTDFWTIQEYAASASGGTDRWGTWWGKVVPAAATTPAQTWTITMSKSTYVNGDTITVNEFGPKNTSTSNAAVRIQVTITIPTMGTLSVIDIGADGSLQLPANLNVNLGPLSLFQINSSFPPKGNWSFDAKVSNPTTGAVIDQDINPFVVQ